jgi:hypothetical protein
MALIKKRMRTSDSNLRYWVVIRDKRKDHAGTGQEADKGLGPISGGAGVGVLRDQLYRFKLDCCRYVRWALFQVICHTSGQYLPFRQAMQTQQ